MKIVIDIEQELYEEILSRKYSKTRIEKAVAKGKTLPEHHGLIDRLELSDHIKNRMIQTAMNNMETILPYSKVCTDIVDNRIDTWIDEVRTIIEGSGVNEDRS